MLKGKSDLKHTYEYRFAMNCTCVKLPWINKKLRADGTYRGDGNLVNEDMDEGEAFSHSILI